jgi:hypothetical protein
VTEPHYTARRLGRLRDAVERLQLSVSIVDVVSTPVAIVPSEPPNVANYVADSDASATVLVVSEVISGTYAEVRTGFEPAYNGFANRCLTAWLPHLA